MERKRVNREGAKVAKGRRGGWWLAWERFSQPRYVLG